MQKLNVLHNRVKTKSVVNQVLDKFKEALIYKELKPGDRLPSESELSSNLGVGKSSIREAIKMLQAVGVVESRQGEGTFICNNLKNDSLNPLVFQLIFEQGTNKDILEMRTIFEPAFTQFAMQKATEDDIKKIEDTIIAFEERIRLGIQEAEDDLAFHFAILKSTHNPFIIRIGETIMQLFRASISKSMRNIPSVALEDHKMIFKAFCEGDTDKLNKTIYESFAGWISMLEADPEEGNHESTIEG